jgi:hypothetical protein
MGAGKIDAYLWCISAYNVQGPLRQNAFDLTAIPDYINENCNKIKPVVFFLEKQQVTVPLQPLSALSGGRCMTCSSLFAGELHCCAGAMQVKLPAEAVGRGCIHAV